MDGQRLDKWLWCARLAKTRALAAALIAAGKLRVNGRRAEKPSRLVRAGDVVTGMRSGRLFVVRVVEAALRRGSAAVAQTLYEDLTPPVADEQPGRPPRAGRGRPSATAAASTPCGPATPDRRREARGYAAVEASAEGCRAAGSMRPARSRTAARSAVTGRLK